MFSKSINRLTLALALPAVGLGILATLSNRTTEAQMLPTGSVSSTEPPPRVMKVSPPPRQPRPTTFEEIQQERQRFDEVDKGISVPATGPATAGMTLRVGSGNNEKVVKLPPDAYIAHNIVLGECVVGKPCPEFPVYVIQRGKSSIALSLPSGTLFGEEVAPGEAGGFDFLKTVLPVKEPLPLLERR